MPAYKVDCPKVKNETQCTSKQPGAKVPLCNWIPSSGQCDANESSIMNHFGPKVGKTVLPDYQLDCPYLTTKEKCGIKVPGALESFCKWTPK